jgi:adhesin HecA-like repeat protein
VLVLASGGHVVGDTVFLNNSGGTLRQTATTVTISGSTLSNPAGTMIQ